LKNLFNEGFNDVRERHRLVDLIDSGRLKADVVIKGGKLVNVHSSEIYEADVALSGTRIAIVGEEAKAFASSKTRILNAEGAFLTPGMIDVHYHVAGTYLTMTNLAMSLLARGTTAIASDFYEYGAVAGPKAIEVGLAEALRTPLKVLFNVPLLAYIQNDPFGNSGKVKPEDLMEMLDWDAAVALGEVQPQTGSDPHVRALIEKTTKLRKTVVGHYVGFHGPGVASWLNLGATSDHESVDSEEAFQKVRSGVRIVAREGSAAVDLMNVLRAVTERGLDPRRFVFCTDEVDPLELKTLGHMDYKVRKAINIGIPPISAVQMATINAAEYYRVDNDIGSITAGKIADIVMVKDLRDFKAQTVIANGRVVAEGGKYVGRLPQPRFPEFMRRTIHIKPSLKGSDFAVRTQNVKATRAKVNIIKAHEGSLITGRGIATLNVEKGVVLPNPKKDILKVSVIDRYGSNQIGSGFMSGFQLHQGAVAESFAPVPEYLVAIGCSDDEVAFAASKVRDMQGGFVVSADQKVIADFHLPILGLMSEDPLDQVTRTLQRATDAYRSLGCRLKSPFLSLMFTTYPLIPKLKITQGGLVDVDSMKYVDVVVDKKS